MFNSKHIIQIFIGQLALIVALASAAPDMHSQHSASNLQALVDSPAMKVISDDDQRSMQQIREHISSGFSDFKQINEVHAFLDKVKLLVQKHPKNLAFAQGELKELQQFLSTEMVTKLIRVDTDHFVMPISDDKMPFAQRAVEEDETTRKLFAGPLRSLIEARKLQQSRHEDGKHTDGNFFQNFWCKITGCNN